MPLGQVSSNVYPGFAGRPAGPIPAESGAAAVGGDAEEGGADRPADVVPPPQQDSQRSRGICTLAAPPGGFNGHLGQEEGGEGWKEAKGCVPWLRPDLLCPGPLCTSARAQVLGAGAEGPRSLAQVAAGELGMAERLATSWAKPLPTAPSSPPSGTSPGCWQPAPHLCSACPVTWLASSYTGRGA